jgi:hypothetical protein
MAWAMNAPDMAEATPISDWQPPIVASSGCRQLIRGSNTIHPTPAGGAARGALPIVF